MNITPKQYARAWLELIQKKSKKEVAEISKKALEKLYKTGKLNTVSKILREMEEIENKESGISQATVVSAYDITQKDAEKIAEKTINSKNIITTLKTDSRIIGGVIVETKNKRWDFSIKNQLKSLSKKLI